MRLIFMGTPQFAVISLEKILQTGQNVTAVVTVPDKPKGRGQKLAPSAVKIAAQKAGLPVLQPVKLRDPQFITQLKTINPDLIVVVAFRILPEEIFTIPPKGTINLHGSLLPKYRGAAPINWAIINGEEKTGVTTFFIQKQVDTGNIIDQEEIDIPPDMTAGELHDQMSRIGAEVLLQTICKIEKGGIKPIKQNDSAVTKAPKIHREDCLIRFSRPVCDVHNFIRGLSPYPAAHSFLDGKMARLFDSRVIEENSALSGPGTILSGQKADEFKVQCFPGTIAIREIQLEGKKRLSIAEFLRGYRLKSNARFDS